MTQYLILQSTVLRLYKNLWKMLSITRFNTYQTPVQFKYILFTFFDNNFRFQFHGSQFLHVFHNKEHSRECKN